MCRYIGTGSRTLSGTSKAGILLEAEEINNENTKMETKEPEVRLAQLQYQLPANEPGALMNMMEDVNGADDEDQDTKECKSFFKGFKFFLSREVSFFHHLYSTTNAEHFIYLFNLYSYV